MGMSRCYSLMKCLLVLFNIVFLLVGAGVVVFACWALQSGRGGEDAAARAGLAALGAWGAALLAGAGAALAGAARDSGALLAAAASLLAVSAVAEAAAACWAASHLPQLHLALHQHMLHSVKHEYGVVDSRTQILDAIQQGLQCCGAESARDWQSSAWERLQAAGDQLQAGGEQPTAEPGPLDLSLGAPATFFKVPPSCCIKPEEGCGMAVGGEGAGGVWRAACGPRAVSALAAAARGPLLAGAALAAAHALALLLALAMCLQPRSDTRYKA